MLNYEQFRCYARSFKGGSKEWKTHLIGQIKLAKEALFKDELDNRDKLAMCIYLKDIECEYELGGHGVNGCLTICTPRVYFEKADNRWCVYTRHEFEAIDHIIDPNPTTK